MMLLFLQGLPGSGKSTFAKQTCEKDTRWARINRDDLRNMRGKYWVPEDEDMITEWEIACARAAVRHGKDIMIDATNFNPEFTDKLKAAVIDEFQKKKWREILSCIRRFKFFDIYVPLFRYLQIDWKFFDTPLHECIRRDSLRANPVGEQVIRRFYNRYLKQHEL